jgi:hypothetical protein
MNVTLSQRSCLVMLFLLTSSYGPLSTTHGASWDPAAADYSGHIGTTIYVSKLGNNSDGSSWQNAYTTIQGALSASPSDGLGGCKIIVRPDTYMEAMLDTSCKGAQGSYNLLLGDTDGRYGSGAKGRVVIDSSAPQGLKSQDWWGTLNCGHQVSMLNWDRWIFRNLYTTGAEGGIGFDLTYQAGAPFTMVLDNCVGIGRFSGTMAGAYVGRKDEPVTYRNCYFADLDWWGDAAGAYVRAEHTSMPDYPDAVFQNCTLIGPDNAFQSGYLYFDKYTRVRFEDSRLISLNFSQPNGTPGTGIIYSGTDGKYLQVDLDDCTMMGYKVFGADTNSNALSYATEGRVAAYVQFQQSLPAGIESLTSFPVDLLQYLSPPLPDTTPEPSMCVLLGCGVATLLGYAWMKRKG